MTPFRFKLNHALRNIRSKIGSSIIVVFTLSILMTLILLSLTMYPVFQQVFYYEAKEVYQTADVILTYDENSQVRIINKRNLELNYASDLSYASVFMNIYTLLGYESSEFYAQIMSAEPYELERLINQDVSNMSDRSMIVTKSFAENHQLITGEELSFFVKDTEYSYQIVQIVDDFGIFSGEKVFIQKEVLMEDLFGLPHLENIGNTIYIDLRSTVSAEEFIQTLKLDSDYQDFLMILAVDSNEIDRQATYSSSTFLGIGVLMLFAIILVLHSLFILFFKDYRIENGVISSLGGDANYTFHVWGIELGIFVLLGSVISWLMTYMLINIGGYFYGIHHFIDFPVIDVLIATAFCSIYLFFEMALMQNRVKRSSSVELSTSFRYSKTVRRYSLGIISSLLYLFFEFIHPFSVGIEAIIQVVLSIIVLFQLFEWMIVWLYTLMKKRNKPSLFSSISIRQMKDNPFFNHSFKVLFVIFLLTISVFSINQFIDTEFDAFSEQLQVDYAIFGIFDYQATMKDDILNDFDVDKVDDGIVYQESLMHFGDEIRRTHFNVSMEYEAFLENYAFETTEEIDFSLSGNLPAIIIPQSMGFIYGVEIGDTIHMDMSRDILNVPFVIVGFFVTNFDNIVYTNIYENESYQDIVSTNTIFIQSNNPEVYTDLIHRYSLDMYYVISMQSFMDDYNDYILSINSMFIFLCTVLIICFVVVMVNNILLIFYSMKSDYAKMIILGQNGKDFFVMLLKEALLIFTILVILCIGETFVFVKYFPKIMLVFHYYKSIVPTWDVLVKTFLFEAVILGGAYAYYFLKIRNLKLIDETKKY